MVEITSYQPGTPAWVDLMTSDPEGARRFYGELLGWEFEVGPPESGHYTMARVRGLDVAGLGGEPAPAGMPTAWTIYFATDDLEGAAKQITDAGGTVTMGPMDVMEEGRLLVAADPTGAIFGLWQAGKHIGARLQSEPGALVWTELATRDLTAAKRFYTAVLGYEWDAATGTGPGGLAYATFSVKGRLAGGALQMNERWPADVPAHWMPYFGVTDADAAVAAASRLGGGAIVAPTDSPYGRFAVLRDPQGGVFTVISTAQELR